MRPLIPVAFFLLFLKRTPKVNKTSSQTDDIPEKDKSETTSRTTTKVKKTFKIKTDSPQKINPQDLKINIAAGGSDAFEKSNYYFFSILWAHFQAYREGLLKKDAPAPWEETRKTDNRTAREWMDFIQQMTDQNPRSWASNIKKLKNRALKTARKVHRSN